MTMTTKTMTIPLLTGARTSPPGAGSPGRVGNFGAWRAVAAVPAMVGSLLLVAVLSAGAGQWAGLVVLAWLVSGAGVLTRGGERVAVRVGCGFRRPSPGQDALLAPAWAGALCRCGLEPGQVDLYVQNTNATNAYAAGGRSVAVTTGVLAHVRTRRLSQRHLEAVLVHELGHHATRACGLGLVTVWLAAPWRYAAALVIGVAWAIAGCRKQPPLLLAAVVVTAVVAAIVQLVRASLWLPAVVLATVATSGVVCPVLDAAVSRASEFAADRRPPRGRGGGRARVGRCPDDPRVRSRAPGVGVAGAIGSPEHGQTDRGPDRQLQVTPGRAPIAFRAPHPGPAGVRLKRETRRVLLSGHAGPLHPPAGAACRFEPA